jgi:hypothetical protein
MTTALPFAIKRPINGRNDPLHWRLGYWFAVHRYLKHGIIDAWDYQILLSCWKHDLVHIAPTRNLVESRDYQTNGSNVSSRQSRQSRLG